MIVPSSRAAAVAMTVLPLRRILLRSLHSSASARANSNDLAAQRDRETSTGRLAASLPASASSLSSKRAKGVLPATSGKRLADLNLDGPRDPDNPKARPPRKTYSNFEPTTYDVPPSSVPVTLSAQKRFDEFEIHPMMLPGVYQKLGDHPKTTPIQSLAFHHFFPFPSPGQRVLLGAETGSGKTLAFLIPIMSHLKLTDLPRENSKHNDHKYNEILPRSIILSPTHELNRQTTGVAKNLVHSMKLSVLGMSQTKDGGIGAERGVKDVFCGTVAMTRRMLGVKKPGGDHDRMDRMRKAWVVPDKLEWLVVDEADVLLGKDFQEETLAVIKHLAADRPDLNIVLCTATVPPALLHLIDTDPLLSNKAFTNLLSPKLHKLPSSLEARFVKYLAQMNPITQIGQEIRRLMADDLLARKIQRGSGNQPNRPRYVVFCNSDAKVDAVWTGLTEKMRIRAIKWTGDAEQRQHGKNGVLEQFLLRPKDTPDMAPYTDEEDKALPQVLVTTSILSRGLDFHPLVSAVLLVDEPRDVLDFVHRAGRAGRAGRTGRVVVFGDGVKGRSSLAEKVGALINTANSRPRSKSSKPGSKARSTTSSRWEAPRKRIRRSSSARSGDGGKALRGKRFIGLGSSRQMAQQ